MKYIYELNDEMVKKYNITSIVVNGWFGVQDKFNQYWDDRKPVYQQIVKRNFTDEELFEMTENPKSYKEC